MPGGPQKWAEMWGPPRTRCLQIRAESISVPRRGPLGRDTLGGVVGGFGDPKKEEEGVGDTRTLQAAACLPPQPEKNKRREDEGRKRGQTPALTSPAGLPAKRLRQGPDPAAAQPRREVLAPAGPRHAAPCTGVTGTRSKRASPLRDPTDVPTRPSPRVGGEEDEVSPEIKHHAGSVERRAAGGNVTLPVPQAGGATEAPRASQVGVEARRCPPRPSTAPRLASHPDRPRRFWDLALLRRSPSPAPDHKIAAVVKG